MPNSTELQDKRLPDITMIAGDTTPWYMTLQRSDGTAYANAVPAGSSCILTLMPYSVANAISPAASTVSPILTKTSSITVDNNGVCVAIFEFETDDTIMLRGKYIYQVEVYNSSDVRIRQGYLNIMANQNRSAS